MSWTRVDRVQLVSALLCRNFDFLPVLERLKSRSKLYLDVEIAHGDDWCVVFGYKHKSGDIILPHISGAIPFYQMETDVWLPVGAALNISGSARDDYLDEIRKIHELGRNEIFILPQFLPDSEETNAADIFTIAEKLTAGQLALEPQK